MEISIKTTITFLEITQEFTAIKIQQQRNNQHSDNSHEDLDLNVSKVGTHIPLTAISLPLKLSVSTLTSYQCQFEV